MALQEMARARRPRLKKKSERDFTFAFMIVF